MALTAGTRIGPYEISGTLGAGGMGEVYRATDTNLKRAVAIKVLPESVATDRDRLARFQREAEVLASLNHPNIAAVYGLERSDGMTALVMELVEGPTLADRIAQEPIPVDEALPIAKQIAEALEAAHEQGIIHRDLKPANIKLRPDGAVKVLDFGLAKALEPVSARVDATASPTITSPAVTVAAPFDVARLEVNGGPVPLVGGVRDAGAGFMGTGATPFGVSADGTLVYVPGNAERGATLRLVWVNRAGAEQPLAAPPREYSFPQRSRDGQRVAMEIVHRFGCSISCGTS